MGIRFILSIMQQLKYRNVTVAGKIGTGTTTLGRVLAEKLGWKFWSGGEFFRAFMKERGMPLEEKSLTPDEVEREVDLGMRAKLQKNEGQIFEAWLSGFVAQGVDGVLKILLVCHDDLRVDRFVNREGVSVDEALRHIKRREEENIKKWTRLYGKEWKEWVGKEPVDFWNPKLYDLVIDTYSHSREETLQLTLDKLGYVETH